MTRALRARSLSLRRGALATRGTPGGAAEQACHHLAAHQPQAGAHHRCPSSHEHPHYYIYTAAPVRNIGRDRARARKIGPCASADPRIASVVEASALRASSSSACAWGEKNRISVTGCRRSVVRVLGLFHTYTEVSSGVLAAGNGSIGRSLSGAVVAPARCTTWSLHPSCWYLSTQLNRSAVVSVIDQFHT